MSEYRANPKFIPWGFENSPLYAAVPRPYYCSLLPCFALVAKKNIYCQEHSSLGLDDLLRGWHPEGEPIPDAVLDTYLEVKKCKCCGSELANNLLCYEETCRESFSIYDTSVPKPDFQVPYFVPTKK